MKRTVLFLVALLIATMFASDAEAGRRKHGRRGGGCGCQAEVVEALPGN